MRRTTYVILFSLLACASVLAQTDLPIGEGPSPTSAIWNDPTFNSSLSIIIGFVIAAITSALKKFEFVNQQPKVVAAGISILASLATVALGVRAGTAYGILIVSTITQLASAVLAFEAVGKAMTSETAKANRARRKPKKVANPSRPADEVEERTTDPL